MIDQEGNVSEPFVTKETMKGTNYLNCLKECLVPFINKHHKNNKILFWPEMAPCHYAKEVTKWMTENNINFFKKNENAPNVPQARPIERFWAICKREYKKQNK